MTVAPNVLIGRVQNELMDLKVNFYDVTLDSEEKLSEWRKG